MVKLSNSNRYDIMPVEPNKRPDYTAQKKTKKHREESFPVFVCETCVPRKVYQMKSGTIPEMHLPHFNALSWYKRKTCQSCRKVIKLQEIEKIRVKRSWIQNYKEEENGNAPES